jgi:hypothetical protein
VELLGEVRSSVIDGDDDPSAVGLAGQGVVTKNRSIGRLMNGYSTFSLI